MCDELRQARIMKVLQLIVGAPDAVHVRAAAAYVHGYIDGLFDEGKLSVQTAQDLKWVAEMHRDKRLSDLNI
ncbi:hypothetical protein H7A76_25520 [Pseudomonas sp. MSSRFD41]|uniref:hypothetical protein n=1 Tax=Pseudomonas sp. MSSRFD41 TaxID=1310370 RepID=UPI00163A5DBD|nr:hypothetical protein [Pseudomonas sp. MSSRFD41]MBC2658810.1 hypothetical protein [Pseudomonas sp. MSSRFD41]